MSHESCEAQRAKAKQKIKGLKTIQSSCQFCKRWEEFQREHPRDDSFVTKVAVSEVVPKQHSQRVRNANYET